MNERHNVRIAATLLTRADATPLLTEWVGEHGICLRTDNPPPVMQLVRVRLVLPPQGAELVVSAMVTRIVLPEAGSGQTPCAELQFWGMDGEPAQRLNEFLAFARAADPHVLDEGARVPDRIQRRYVRRSARLPVQLRVGDVTTYHVTRDVSEGGMFISTPEPAPVGTQVVVSLTHLVSLERITVEAVVRRRVFGTDGGIGVELTDVGEAVRGRLAAFLADIHDAGEERPARPDVPRPQVAIAS